MSLTTCRNNSCFLAWQWLKVDRRDVPRWVLKTVDWKDTGPHLTRDAPGDSDVEFITEMEDGDWLLQGMDWLTEKVVTEIIPDAKFRECFVLDPPNGGT